MEFFTLDDEGVRAGIDVGYPQDPHIHIRDGLKALVVERLQSVRPGQHAARICLAGGSAHTTGNKLEINRASREYRARALECGAVMLRVDIPPGVGPDGEPAEVRYEYSDGNVFPLRYREVLGPFDPRFFVVPLGGKITIHRGGETATEYHMGLPRTYIVQRTSPGSTFYPLIPHSLVAEGWDVQVLP